MPLLSNVKCLKICACSFNTALGVELKFSVCGGGNRILDMVSEQFMTLFTCMLVCVLAQRCTEMAFDSHRVQTRSSISYGN